MVTLHTRCIQIELLLPNWSKEFHFIGTNHVLFIMLKPQKALIWYFCRYRSGTVNSKTVNSKFHLIRSFFEYFARILSFHVQNANWNQSTVLLEYFAESIQHASSTSSTYPGSCKTCFSCIPVFGGKVSLIFPIIYLWSDLQLIWILAYWPS